MTKDEIEYYGGLFANASKKLLLFIIALGMAASCGFNTVFYTYYSNIDIKINKNSIWLLAVFLSGVILNFLLYSRDMVRSNEGYSISVEFIIAFIINALAGLAAAFVAYHTAVNCPMHLNPVLIWALAITAGLGSFLLFFTDTRDFLKKFPFKDFFEGFKKNFNAQGLLKIIALGIFSVGTFGMLKTYYDSIAIKLDWRFALVLVAAVAIVEIIFLWKSAKSVINNKSFWRNSWPLLVFALIPILINGFSNGILDAGSFVGNFGIIMAICGCILSISLMLNTIRDRFEDEEPASAKEQLLKFVGQLRKLFDFSSFSQSRKAIGCLFFSGIALIATLCMLQFQVPSLEIWLPIMITASVAFGLGYILLEVAKSSKDKGRALLNEAYDGESSRFLTSVPSPPHSSTGGHYTPTAKGATSVVMKVMSCAIL